MYSITDLHNLQDDFVLGYEPVFQTDKVDVSKAFAEKDINQINTAVKYLFSKALLELPQGVPVPRIRQDFSELDGNFIRDNIRISVAGTDFSTAAALMDTATNESVATFIQDSMKQLIQWYVENENINEINATLDRISEAAGNSFKVHVVRSDKALHSISDVEVQLGVNPAFLYEYNTLLLFSDKKFPSEDEDLSEGELLAIENWNDRIDKAFTSAVEEWESPSSVAFLGDNRFKLLRVISQIGNKKLRTLLREAVGQNKSWLNRSKKDMVVKYDQDGVFGIIERKNGQVSVLLSPVNTETGEPVDVDILS